MLVDTTFIYALKDPETGLIRYIGKSNNPKRRLRSHLMLGRRDGTCHRANWLNSLAVADLKPILEIIDEVPLEHWPQLEVAYIEFFLEQGCDLVNGTKGGDNPPSWSGEKHPMFGKPGPMLGRLGANHPMFGKILDLEARCKIRTAITGIKRSPETLAKLRKKRKGASSLFNGVCWSKACQKWVSAICVACKNIHLGTFSDEVEAAEVYDIAAKIYHGAHAVLNFPD